LPTADKAREEYGTEARNITKARVGDEDLVLGGGHGSGEVASAIGEFFFCATRSRNAEAAVIREQPPPEGR